MPDAPIHYACDQKWWKVHYESVKAGYRGTSYTIDDHDTSRNPKQDYDLVRVRSMFGAGLGKDLIHYGPSGGGNSGYQAVNLAYLLGAKTIVLLGFDMFGTHFFGEHPAELKVATPFNSFIEAFATIDPVMYGIEIINCSRRTALTCFPRMNIEELWP